MARTRLNIESQDVDESVTRSSLNVSTAGSAVIRKVIAGDGITLTSTGADLGTGDVTISALAGGGGSSTYSTTDITIAPVRKAQYTTIVSVVGGTSNSIYIPQLAPNVDFDIDELEDVDITMIANSDGTATITLFSDCLLGVYKVNYQKGEI